jgi:hypothetical protein
MYGMKVIGVDHSGIHIMGGGFLVVANGRVAREFAETKKDN